ncbi:hypothetical protein LX36DRAFT_67985 [Colletotrichum falcatum]|nr:hypothetical protein LX36DRAFT_67985 [Colletotrichum falcatum]
MDGVFPPNRQCRQSPDRKWCFGVCVCVCVCVWVGWLVGGCKSESVAWFKPPLPFRLMIRGKSLEEG